MESVREMLKERQNKILNGNVTPDEAATILTEVASLMGNISEEVLARDMGFNEVLAACMLQEGSAAKAKIKAQITQEYKEMREAHNAEKNALQLIQSLKYFIRTKEREIETVKYQQG